MHWALDQVGCRLSDLEMVELDPGVPRDGLQRHNIEVGTDLDQTADRFDAIEPGLGERYRQFVDARDDGS